MEITAEIQALLDQQKADINKERDELEKGLKKNRDDLLEEKDQIQRDKQALADIAEADRLAKAAAEGDTKTLQESYLQRESALQAQIDEMKNKNVSAKKEAVANSFVKEFGIDDPFSRESLADAYKKRIDIRDGNVVVLDPTGSLTALTVEDLNKEFISASKYANHIKGTGATGGGATGNKSGGAALKKPKDMNSTERIAFKQNDPHGFKKAFNL